MMNWMNTRNSRGNGGGRVCVSIRTARGVLVSEWERDDGRSSGRPSC